MSVHEHVAAVQKQTGKSPEELSLLAKAEYLFTHNEIVDWLKTKYELSHGHATTISHLILLTPHDEAVENEALTALLPGSKVDWLPACRELFTKVEHFGHDVIIDLESDPIPLQRGAAYFGVVQVGSSKLEIGINVPGAPFDNIFTDATGWNDSMTHKATFIVQQQINDKLIDLLRKAYDRSI